MSKHSNTISGKIGPVVFYTVNGKQYGRTKAGRKIRQTVATKKRSSAFAVASKLSAAARIYLGPVFKLKDGSRYSRLTGAFSNWLGREQMEEKPSGPIDSVLGFEINPPRMMSEKWSGQLQVEPTDDMLIITINDLIPTEMMSRPKDTSTARLTISSVVITLSSPNYAVAASDSIDIPFNDKLFTGQILQQKLKMPRGSVILTGFAIECLDNGGHPVKMRAGYNLPARMLYAEWKN